MNEGGFEKMMIIFCAVAHVKIKDGIILNECLVNDNEWGVSMEWWCWNDGIFSWQ